MPLISFSEPAHISKLLDGTKTQTTRLKRKNPLKVGDTLYCYYKSRQRPSCKNCIVKPCTNEQEKQNSISSWKITNCSRWTNYFGEAIITKIIPFSKIIEAYGFQAWAELDGFENFKEAYLWFSNRHGIDWGLSPLEVIIFEPKWVKI